MGTNYEFRFKACDRCDRYEAAHVGKKSAGWSFLFKAYEHRLMNAEHPDWGYDPRSPFGFEVRSRNDWRTVLLNVPGELFNEYGDHIEDPLGWLDGLEPPDAVLRRFEDSSRHYPTFYERTDWRDAEGFRFEPREFS